MKCKDCKYLGKPYVHSYWPGGDADEIETEYHVCDYVKHTNRYDTKRPPNGDVGVIDGSGYYAALVVQDDFGCIHFEQKSTGDAGQ